jgi:hypothetical protein
MAVPNTGFSNYSFIIRDPSSRTRRKNCFEVLLGTQFKSLCFPQSSLFFLLKAPAQSRGTKAVRKTVNQWPHPDMEICVDRTNASRRQIFHVLPSKTFPQMIGVGLIHGNWPVRCENPIKMLFQPKWPEESCWRQDANFRWIGARGSRTECVFQNSLPKGPPRKERYSSSQRHKDGDRSPAKITAFANPDCPLHL